MAFNAKSKHVAEFVNDAGESIVVREGDVLSDVAYLNRAGEVVTKSGKVVEFIMDKKHDVVSGIVVSAKEASEGEDEPMVDHVNYFWGIKCTTKDKYASTVAGRHISLDSIQSIGGILEGVVKAPEASAEVVSVVSTMVAGQEMEVPVMEIVEPMEIPAGVVLRGANAGVSPVQNFIDGIATASEVPSESVLKGAITITGDVTLDGFTIADTAEVSVTKGGSLKLVNCVIGDLSNTNKSFPIMMKCWEEEVKLEVSDCVFKANAKGAYNLFESNAKLADGSYVRNCYFQKGCSSNNYINIYAVADNATISIENNVFEYSCNAVRVGCKGTPICTINIKNNRYMETATGDYAGLVLIQPYGLQTINMARCIVNIDGTINESGVSQLWYYWKGATNEVMPKHQRPKVYVNGVLQSYK